MTPSVQDHYSYRFKLNIKHTPTKATDRFSRPLLLVALVFGFMLLSLGLYFMLHSNLHGITDIENKLPSTNVHLNPLISPVIFNIISILLGLFIILSCFNMLIR